MTELELLTCDTKSVTALLLIEFYFWRGTDAESERIVKFHKNRTWPRMEMTKQINITGPNEYSLISYLHLRNIHWNDKEKIEYYITKRCRLYLVGSLVALD